MRARFGDRAPWLVETTLLRRRAAGKLGELCPNVGVSQWLFTDEALQQATAAPVARHRARRLAGRVVHDATCSIGTELAALRELAVRAVGSDIDPVRLAMARHNLAALGMEADLCRADVLHPVTRDAVVVIDPARRSNGRRRFHLADYQPGLGPLLDRYRGRDVVVKCAPGIDFEEVGRLGFEGEIEVISYRGGVREACLWSAGLAGSGIRRRASILDSGEQIGDDEPDDCGVRPAGKWIVDPDGAVVRAGLVRNYGARHGLWQLDPQIATCPVTGCRLRCAGSRCSSSWPSTSVGCVRCCQRWIAGQPKSWCAALRSIPTLCGDGSGCGAADRWRWSSPALVPGP